jgi:hypothetical protein
MNIAHLSLASLIFQLRYAHAFRLWDRAGAIAADAVYRWPTLTLREGTPQRIRLTLGTRAEINVQLEQASVAVADSTLKLEELLPYSSFLSETVPKVLEVKSLNEIRVKATFLKEYANIDDAVRDFGTTGMTKVFVGKHFGFEGKIAPPSSVSIRFEGDFLGCTNGLQIRKRAVKLDVPQIGISDFEIVTKEHVELVYECDYFTTATIEVGQLNANRWIEEAMRTIRRDANIILEG